MSNPFKRAWPNFGRDLWLNAVVGSFLIPRPLRWRLLRASGMKVEHSDICPRAWFGNTNLAIGEGTFVNYGVRFNTAGGITIGANCDIAMDVSFVTSTHDIGPHTRRAGAQHADPIVVGDGVWIGARALILPGVTIGDGVVIAAGAVVSTDCPSGIWGGVPARMIREFADEEAVA